MKQEDAEWMKTKQYHQQCNILRYSRVQNIQTHGHNSILFLIVAYLADNNNVVKENTNLS